MSMRLFGKIPFEQVDQSGLLAAVIRGESYTLLLQSWANDRQKCNLHKLSERSAVTQALDHGAGSLIYRHEEHEKSC